MASRSILAATMAVALGHAAGPAAALPAKALAPIPAATLALMQARGTDARAPVLFRAYKKEAEIEVWKRAADGRFVRVKTFPICRWSGQLGPKHRTGDRQTPEGFYTVAGRQMNPNSHYYLSFDVGYPNAYDRAHGYTGSAVMVHGTCSSMGCFAMTDRAVAEIYAIAREALAGGQSAFPFQSFPFRMTAANMARHRSDPNIAFWRNLKEGSDRFEATGEPPTVAVVAGRYGFAPLPDPAREALAKERVSAEEARTAGLIGDGVASVRTTYADGGQHPTFVSLIARGTPVGEVSRPEALAFAGQEITVIPARRRPLPATAVATADVMRAALTPLADPTGEDPGPADAVAALFTRASVAAGASRLVLAEATPARGVPAFLAAGPIAAPMLP